MFIKNLVKKLFHLVDEEDYDELIKANAFLIEKKNEVTKFLSVYTKYEERLPNILLDNNANLIGIQQSKNGELLHILHAPKSRYIFVLSPYIVDNTSRNAVTQFPCLEYTFYKEHDHIIIDELHSDCGWHNFQTGLYTHENRGYGTALLKALVTLAFKNGFDKHSKVTGTLSHIDAKDEKKKMRRNMFYYKRGFDIIPDLDAVNGSICSTLERIDESIKIIL